MVLVLGTRPNIDARVRQSGGKPCYSDGQRVTDFQTMQAAMQAAGAARMQVEARLSKVRRRPGLRAQRRASTAARGGEPHLAAEPQSIPGCNA